MSFTFGQATTASGGTFGTNTPSGSLFGGGDAKLGIDNKASIFGSPQQSTPAFGGFSFAANTTAASSNLFATTPATTTSAFGANKTIGFGGFASPPVQTVGSPGFGQSSNAASIADTKPQAGFGAPQQSSAFGAPATQAPAFGSPTGSGVAFGKPGGGFNFTTPASGFGSPQPTATAASSAQSFGLGATPAFGNTAFAPKPFAASSTTAAVSPTPATSTAAFGANKSISFGGFASPPVQTVGSPGFGQPPNAASIADTKPQAGFGAPQQSSAFGAPATQAPAFGSPSGAGASFGKPGGGFSFTTPASGFGQPQPTATAATTTQSLGLGATPAFGNAALAPKPYAASTTAAAAPTFGNTNTSGFSFGQAQSTSQPNQNQAANQNQTTTQTFMTPSNQATALTGQPNQTMNFSKPQTSQPTLSQSSQPAFGTTQATQNFGTSTQASAQPTPTFGKPSQPTSSFGTTQIAQATSSFGTAPATSGLNFSTTSSTQATSSFATSNLSFGGNQTSQASTKSTASTGQGFGLSSGLPFGNTTSTTVATTSASTPSGITALGKSTAAMPSLSTSIITTVAGPPAVVTSITYSQLEESINKWSLELTEQENNFIRQATMINAWDRLLVANGEKILELNDAVETVKNEQQTLEHELDFILAQQKELEELLKPLEKQLLEDTSDRMRDPERDHMYSLAETLDTQLRQMSEDLKEVIEHLNETNRSQDSNDPIVQIGRILSAHMSSMQWVEVSAAHISAKLDALRAAHDALRSHDETALRLAYE